MAHTMTAAPPRYLSLDAMRGVAVMGILVANLPGFGLPAAAYSAPLAWGGDRAIDRALWFANFVLVEGKLRGLFSFLFGASLLLVLERARTAGRNEVAFHLRRMTTLFIIGCAHLYLLWWGDILAHYALVGTVALLFAGLGTRLLLVLGIAVLGIGLLDRLAESALLFADTPAGAAYRDAYRPSFGIPDRATLNHEVAVMRGTWWRGVVWRWREVASPWSVPTSNGLETLSAMLVGMAGYRSGFATGGWSRRGYAWCAGGCLAVAFAGYALLGWWTWASGFDVRYVHLGAVLASAPFRVLGYVGYAALVMVLIRDGGWWTRRIAAAGRMAFSNYLGTSLVMAAIFDGWGLGLFGRIDRAELYLLALPGMAAMLAWSHRWLARHRHGPMEWL